MYYNHLTRFVIFLVFVHFEYRSDDISFGIPENHKSAIAKHHRDVSQGQQKFQAKGELAPVGEPVAHLSASKQVSLSFSRFRHYHSK